jgi:hypothetical protein
LFLVDAKNWSGNVTAWDGGLYQHLGHGAERTSQSRHAEVLKVHGMASYMAAETGLPTRPVISLAGSSEKTFGEPQFIKGVWVVPVSMLVSWLESRPAILDRESAARTATLVMTSFPSTTTDPSLLAAMGAAASPSKRSPRSAVTAGRPARRRKADEPFAARLGRAIGKLFLAVVVLAAGVTLLPPLLSSAMQHLASSGDRPAAPPATTTTTTTPRAKVTAKPTTPPPGPPDCANASAAEIATIIGRTVQPIAVRSGCAWGTRLDDASTTLVTIRMSAGHKAYDMQLATSAKQKRVVYGTTSDELYHRATALWVASGQPITKGKSGVVARADTYVMVARTALNISDERARQMALAIAAAANGTS